MLIVPLIINQIIALLSTRGFITIYAGQKSRDQTSRVRDWINTPKRAVMTPRCTSPKKGQEPKRKKKKAQHSISHAAGESLDL